MTKIKNFLVRNKTRLSVLGYALAGSVGSMLAHSANAQVTLTPNASTTAAINLVGPEAEDMVSQALAFGWGLFKEYFIYIFMVVAAIGFIFYFVKRKARI